LISEEGRKEEGKAHKNPAKSEGKVKAEVVPIHAMKANRGSKSIAPVILKLDGGAWLASRPDRFTSRKERLYPLRLGGSQNWSGRFGDEQFLVLAGI
jgi:hypothetical protein